MTKQREMNHRKWLWTAVTVLYVLFIFHNSATVAVESSRQSGRGTSCLRRSVWLVWELKADG